MGKLSTHTYTHTHKNAETHAWAQRLKENGVQKTQASESLQLPARVLGHPIPTVHAKLYCLWELNCFTLSPRIQKG